MKRRTKIFLSILLFILIFFITINVIPPKKVVSNNPFIIGENERPLIAAHRGGKNLRPENTLMAIDYSYENFCVDIIEMDLYITKDEHLILSHNSTINSYTELKGEDDYYIKDHTLSEIQQYNFGYQFEKNGEFPYRDILNGVNDEDKSKVLHDNKLRVLTINELFEKYSKTNVKYIIEIKNSSDLGLLAVDKLVEIMDQYNVTDKVCVGTFKDEVENYLSEKYPHILRGASMGVAAKFIITEMFKVNLFDNSTFSALQIPTSYTLKVSGKKILTLNLNKESYVKRAHKREMSVQYWTINDKEEMKEVIKLGADVIMTDNPDILFEVLKEMGYFSGSINI